MGSGTVSIWRRILDRSSNREQITAKPEHYGRFMTLCIAAIARKEKQIVTVSDFMLSNEFTSTEASAAKVSRVGKTNRWLHLYSGDPSVCIKIKTAVDHYLSGESEEMAIDVIRSYERAFREELSHTINGEILSRFGLNREQFLKEGRQMLGEAKFKEIADKISKAGLGTDFLVAGFGASGRPSLISFSDPGISYIHNASSYHAIGCGSIVADALLMNRFSPFDPLTNIIYQLAETKFRCESAVPGVGQSTFITVLDSGGKWTGIRPTKALAIKQLWAEKGQPSIPSEADKVITEAFTWEGQGD
jgi:hypothetical protein